MFVSSNSSQRATSIHPQTPLTTILACALQCLARQTPLTLTLLPTAQFTSELLPIYCSLNVLPLVILFDLSKSSPFTTHSTPQCFSLSSFTRTLYLTLQTPVTSTNCYSYYPTPPTCVRPYKPSTLTTFHFLTKRQVSVVSTFVHFHSLSIFFQQPHRITGTLINPVHSNLLSHRQPFNAAPTLP